MMAGKSPNQIGVERLGEACIRDRAGDSAHVEVIGGGKTLREARTKTEDGNLVPFADNSAATDRKRLAAFGQRHADALSARVTERDRTFIVSGSCCHHMYQLGFV